MCAGKGFSSLCFHAVRKKKTHEQTRQVRRRDDRYALFSDDEILVKVQESHPVVFVVMLVHAATVEFELRPSRAINFICQKSRRHKIIDLSTHCRRWSVGVLCEVHMINAEPPAANSSFRQRTPFLRDRLRTKEHISARAYFDTVYEVKKPSKCIAWSNDSDVSRWNL